MTSEEMKTRDSEQRMLRFYRLAEIAEKLTPKQPFFWMTDGSMYAIEERMVTRKNKETGKMETKLEPTNYRRLDKNRNLKGRQRVAARKLENKLQKAAEVQKNEFGQGFSAAAAGRDLPGSQEAQA